MGVDLKLFPMYMGGKHHQFSLEILQYRPNKEDYDSIKAVDQYPVDSDFSTYIPDKRTEMEEDAGECQRDCYGNQVTWAFAKDLKRCSIPNPQRAYIHALDDLHKVAIYWC